jgi:hypothetical protein
MRLFILVVLVALDVVAEVQLLDILPFGSHVQQKSGKEDPKDRSYQHSSQA